MTGKEASSGAGAPADLPAAPIVRAHSSQAPEGVHASIAPTLGQSPADPLWG